MAGVDRKCDFVKVSSIHQLYFAVNYPLQLFEFCFMMLQADFMKMPFSENHFDAVYAIEATCHAPDAVCVYRLLIFMKYFSPDSCTCSLFVQFSSNLGFSILAYLFI